MQGLRESKPLGQGMSGLERLLGDEESISSLYGWPIGG